MRPEGLMTKADDYLMHGLLIAILLTGFVIEGAAWRSPNSANARWRAGRRSACGRPRLRVGERRVARHAASRALVAALRSRLRVHRRHPVHASSATSSRPPSTTSSGRPRADGSSPRSTWRTRRAEQFGAAHVADLTWKDIFDADACTRCKRCQDRCPAYATEQAALADEGGAADRRRRLRHARCATCRGHRHADALWACTTCRACQEICPAAIEHVDKIVELRRNLVLMEGEFPGEEVDAAMRQHRGQRQPARHAATPRAATGPTGSTCHRRRAEDSEVDVLYFAGCYASFDPRNQKVAAASSRSVPGGRRHRSASSARRRSAAASRCASSATSTSTRCWPRRTSRRSRRPASRRS